MTAVPPIRQQVVVQLPAAEAFALFTAGIGGWWPMARHSVFGEGSSVAFEGARLIERSGERSAVWGTVREWTPGERLSFTWHPGSEMDQASLVQVSFTPSEDGTLVTLEHSGWEVYADPQAARDQYDNGWPLVLARYQESARLEPGEPQEATGPPETSGPPYTWVALLHQPGPAAPDDGRSIFQDPRFADHVQFLSRMAAQGYLIAAGPLLDEQGSGMTILRLPGEGRVEEARRLATEDDLSVKAGFFAVSVRPWQVLMSA